MAIASILNYILLIIVGIIVGFIIVFPIVWIFFKIKEKRIARRFKKDGLKKENETPGSGGEDRSSDPSTVEDNIERPGGRVFSFSELVRSE